MTRRWIKFALVGPLALFLAIQLVPYGRNHTNPPVTGEPAWSDPAVRALADRACFDCHSNQTRWPWYANVAPGSWLMQYDVDKGRAQLNFSEWNRPQEEADEAAEEVEKGKMPPAVYTPLHPEAVLSPSERQALIEGLKKTLGTEKVAARER